MKAKRFLPIALSLLLMGSATVFAGTLWGEFEDYSKIKLMVNDKEQMFLDSEVPPFLIKGSPVIPSKVISKTLHTLVKWDDQSMTLSMYKPNVNMVVAKSITIEPKNKDDIGIDYKIRTPFGTVKKGDKGKIFLYAQVDNLKTSIASIKISIETPSGIQATAAREETLNDLMESFDYVCPFELSFDELGDYKIKFSIKLDNDSEYIVVSEKTIVSR